MCYDELRNYRKIILKGRRINIFMLVIWAFPIPFLAWAALNDFRASFIIFLPMIFMLLSIKLIIDDNRLLNQLSSIEENNTLNKTSEYILQCPKVVILRVPEVRATYSRSPCYYGIRLTDVNKNKYYYFFEDTLRHDNDSINMIIEKFNREIHIQCYENTSIIKTIEKSPRFIHIRYGSFCE